MAPDPTWSLLDAVERAAAEPRSFFVPTPEEREALAPGDLAKLVFLRPEDAPGPDAERMWVEVTDRAPGGYVGRLVNDPVAIPDLRQGERVEFEPRHVVQLPADEPDPYEGQAAFVSERVFDDDDPGIAVATFEPDDAGREIAGGRRLSGWMLLAGDETDEDVDDPERIRLPSLPWLRERNPEVQEVLDGHDGSAGSWIRTGDTWERQAPAGE